MGDRNRAEGTVLGPGVLHYFRGLSRPTGMKQPSPFCFVADRAVTLLPALSLSQSEGVYLTPISKTVHRMSHG